jgi:hypothetical protein
MTDDGEIRAQVLSAANAGSQACVGLMMRENLTAGSRYDMLGLSPDGTLTSMARTATGSTAASSPKGTAPPSNIWLRVVRTGNVFYFYRSSDGTNWSYVDSGTKSMASSIYVGIAVASGSATNLTSYTCNNVTVVP